MKIRGYSLNQLLKYCRQNEHKCEDLQDSCPLRSLCRRIQFNNLEFFYGKKLDEELEEEKCK